MPMSLYYVAYILLEIAEIKENAQSILTTDIREMDFMFVLVWTMYYFPFNYIDIGKTFREYGCKPDNCIVSDSEELLGNDISKFNAVIFDVFHLFDADCDVLPKRYPYQKYIALSTEPFHIYRFKDSRYDAFFNWTATYRLDSDIPYPFIAIKDQTGQVVGPKIDMHWETDMKDNLDKDLVNRLKNKSKAVAWFVSNCETPSKREKYVHELNVVLSRYDLGIDIYGLCGDLRCPKEGDLRMESFRECGRMMGRKYFFYLAFENVFSEDYVSEKLLKAVNNDVVPIVYGGANYSRFLPPNSYLDARRHTPEELGYIIQELMYNPTMYRRYFRWKSHYSYHDAMKNVNICSICTELNNKTKFESVSVYNDIRAWLHR